MVWKIILDGLLFELEWFGLLGLSGIGLLRRRGRIYREVGDWKERSGWDA